MKTGSEKRESVGLEVYSQGVDRERLAELAERVGMPLEPWQLSVLEHVMNGDKVSFVYPKRHSLSEYDAAVKRIYRAFGYEIVSGDGWWGAKRLATTA